MEVITIQTTAFQKLLERLISIEKSIKKIEEQRAEEIELGDNRNLTTREVLELLKISKRSLQRLSDERIISYSRIGCKCLYKLSEVKRVVKYGLIPNKEIKYSEINFDMHAL